jgi:hypothetical protein
MLAPAKGNLVRPGRRAKCGASWSLLPPPLPPLITIPQKVLGLCSGCEIKSRLGTPGSEQAIKQGWKN